MSNKKGISLISLVITIIVIIILAAIVIFTGLGTPDKANFAKFTSEFADFNLAVQNDYMNRYAKYATENKVRSKDEIYYEIASGKDASEMESEEKLLVADLGSEISNGLRGTYYFEITDDRNVTGWKEDKTYYQSYETERHFVTDEGEVFITPGYGIEENGATKWYINESKYYGGEPQGGEGGGETPPEETARYENEGETLAQSDNETITVRVLTTGDVDELDIEYKESANVKQIVQGTGETSIAPIPTGFSYLAGTPDTGLVIKDGSNNEFVWIPVADVTTLYTSGSEVSMNHYNSSFSVKTDKWGKMPIADDGGVTKRTIGNPASADWREPAVVVGTGAEYDAANYGTAGFTSLKDMAEKMKESFNDMLTSVGKYGGFYIARYELGEGNVSKAGVRPQVSNTATTTANYIGVGNWYNLYANCKAMYGSGSSVVSSMIWGCQWDAMVSFIGNPSPSGLRRIRGLTGSYGDGGTAVKNVCDTRTSVYDYTVTAYSTSYRARRGGSWEDSHFASTCGGTYPTSTLVNVYGARAQLYIK